MNPNLTIQLQRSVNARLNAFRSDFPEGANVGGFAEFVRESLIEVNEILHLEKSEAVAPDRRRIVRYYQSQGWISAPSKKTGREVIYDENQLVQMLLSYCLRELKTPITPKEEIKKVAALSLDMCLQRFSNGLAPAPAATLTDTPDDGSLVEQCDHFHIQLVASRGEPETGRVARSIRALARHNDGAYFTVDVCDEEIDLGDGIASEKVVNDVNDVTDIIDGDGSIRSLIPPFREQQKIGKDALVQIVTNRPHVFNWFADWGPTNPRDGVLHLGNYEFQFGAASAAVSASYSLLLAVCGELERRGISPYDLFHRFHARGCLFDSCERKEEIVLKLLAGDICKDCLEKLRPHFSNDLLREITLFQDAIRDRVRVLRQYVPDPEEDLQTLLRLVFVHSLVAANAPGGSTAVSLPKDGDDLEEWVFASGVGTSLGIDRELKALKRLADGRMGNGEADEDKWSHSHDGIVKILHRLHPNLQIVRIDSVRLKSGEFIAEGASLLNSQAESREIAFQGDLASFGITDTGATYAQFGKAGTAPSFAKIGTHLRVVGKDGTIQAVLRLPDNTLVDYTDGLPLRGCTAFSGVEGSPQS